MAPSGKPCASGSICLSGEPLKFSAAHALMVTLGTCRRGMHFAMRCIDHPSFLIGFIDQNLKKLFPNALSRQRMERQ